jgi:hypothetical protein
MHLTAEGIKVYKKKEEEQDYGVTQVELEVL